MRNLVFCKNADDSSHFYYSICISLTSEIVCSINSFKIIDNASKEPKEMRCQGFIQGHFFIVVGSKYKVSTEEREVGKEEENEASRYEYQRQVRRVLGGNLQSI